MLRDHRLVSFAVVLALAAGCVREAPPPGVLVPPAATGSIDASPSQWRALSRVGAPLSQELLQPIWTASGLAVLSRGGGGGFYDPYRDSWRAVAPGPWAMLEVTDPAFFTDRAILLTGSRSRAVVPRAFDLASATWRTFPELPEGFPIEPALAWSGATLFVWGGALRRSHPAPGESTYEDTGSGAILDVASGTWRPVAREGAPSPRAKPVATWTGAAFVVWGGASSEDGMAHDCASAQAMMGCEQRSGGALYDPARERWREMPAEGAPPLLAHPEILWTGRVVLLWDKAASAPQTTVYGYDPRAGRWLAPLLMPVAFQGRTTGVAGGRALFLDEPGGQALDLDTRTFSPIPIPDEIRACWRLSTALFEAGRVVVVSPPGCHGGTLAVSALDPRKGTWKTAKLPPVPRPGGQSEPFNGSLVWTGEHLIAWGGITFEGPDTSCSNPPAHMPCDPAGPPPRMSNEGFIIRPSL